MVMRARQRTISRREFLKDSAAITSGGAALRDFGSPQESAGGDFYVAVDGNDNWSGRLPSPNAGRTDGPFLTMAGARDAIRRIKGTGPVNHPLTVRIRGGRYSLREPFVLQSCRLGNRDVSHYICGLSRGEGTLQWRPCD